MICVVVNWNGWQDTVECLTSLRQQDYDGLQVIVVDNGSTNESVRMIREAHPWATVIETGRNLGFPSGCNAGTRLAIERGADYVWLLNNDTIAPADTAGKLLQTARENPEAGAVGAILYYMHDPGHVQAWGGGKINLWTGFVSHFNKATVFDENTYLTGASMLLPRRSAKRWGYFMKATSCMATIRTFACAYAAMAINWSSAKDTAILHKEGASSPKRSPLIDRFATTSSLRLLKRHAPIPAVSQAIYLALRFANRLRRREWKNIAAVWEGVAVYFNEPEDGFTDRL